VWLSWTAAQQQTWKVRGAAQLAALFFGSGRDMAQLAESNQAGLQMGTFVDVDLAIHLSHRLESHGTSIS
jgi:hypothetical protein